MNSSVATISLAATVWNERSVEHRDRPVGQRGRLEALA